jgi:uncharacterized protein DUF4375
MGGGELEEAIFEWLRVRYPEGPTWFDRDKPSPDAPPLEARMLYAMNAIEYNISNGGWSQFLWNCFERWRAILTTAQDGYALIGANEQANALNILRELCERDEADCISAQAREDGSMSTFAEYTRKSYGNRGNDWEALFWGDIYEKRLAWLEANESRIRTIINRHNA